MLICSSIQLFIKCLDMHKPMYTAPNFKTQMLNLITYVQLFYMTVKSTSNALYSVSLFLLRMLVFMMYFNTKAIPTNDADYNCYLYKGGRSCLYNHTRPISRHIAPVIINHRFGHWHTHMHTQATMMSTWTKQFQETRCRPLNAWFKNIVLLN